LEFCAKRGKQITQRAPRSSATQSTTANQEAGDRQQPSEANAPSRAVSAALSPSSGQPQSSAIDSIGARLDSSLLATHESREHNSSRGLMVVAGLDASRQDQAGRINHAIVNGVASPRCQQIVSATVDSPLGVDVTPSPSPSTHSIIHQTCSTIDSAERSGAPKTDWPKSSDSTSKAAPTILQKSQVGRNQVY
jgi:hypothetical protein